MAPVLGPPRPEPGSSKLSGASWTLHLIPTCRLYQRQCKLWHLLATGQVELVFGRSRRARPQAHRLSTPVRRRQGQACQPKEMNQNNYSVICWEQKREEIVFFFCRKGLGKSGPCWAGKFLPDSWLETQIISHSTLPDEVRSALAVRVVKWLVEEASGSATQQKMLLSCICLVVREQVSPGGEALGVTGTSQVRQLRVTHGGCSGPRSRAGGSCHPLDPNSGLP